MKKKLNKMELEALRDKIVEKLREDVTLHNQDNQKILDDIVANHPDISLLRALKVKYPNNNYLTNAIKYLIDNIKEDMGGWHTWNYYDKDVIYKSLILAQIDAENLNDLIAIVTKAYAESKA
tara:strand:+ start:547 stop:912 length:366 start_codon:yes stop_codon:yes gene_type:complete